MNLMQYLLCIHMLLLETLFLDLALSLVQFMLLYISEEAQLGSNHIILS